MDAQKKKSSINTKDLIIYISLAITTICIIYCMKEQFIIKEENIKMNDTIKTLESSYTKLQKETERSLLTLQRNSDEIRNTLLTRSISSLPHPPNHSHSPLPNYERRLPNPDVVIPHRRVEKTGDSDLDDLMN